MVNVDTVYQKVLAIANKEQRGYITPQEFNLLADKAQLDLVNNYFHSMKMAQVKPKNQTEASDNIEMLAEKMAYIRTTAVIPISQATQNAPATNTGGARRIALLPKDVYKIASIYTQHGYIGETSTTVQVSGNEVIRVSKHDLLNMFDHPLTNPTITRPVYTNDVIINTNTIDQQQRIELFPRSLGFGTGSNLTVEYYKKPEKPEWAFVVVNQKALYNTNKAKHFKLHPTEEEPLVMRILELASVTIQRDDLQKAAITQKQITKQEQNS